MGEKLKNFIYRIKRIGLFTIKKAMDPYFAGNSAEVAFYLLMSIVPSILILAHLLNVFDLSVDVIKNLILEYANPDLASIILPLLTQNSSGALSLFLVVLALWSGSKAIFSLMRISNYAYGGGPKAKNPLIRFLRERARAIITIFIIIITLIFAIGILIFGRVIVEAVLTYINDFMGEEFDINTIWLNIRWVLGFIMYFFMVTSIYYLLPRRSEGYADLIDKAHKWRSARKVIGAWLSYSKHILKIIFPGSIFASIGMMLATWVYSLYLDRISVSHFNILYGSLGAAVLLLLWFYILAFVLVLGIQINSIWDNSKRNFENE
jgi:membrane protein